VPSSVNLNLSGPILNIMVLNTMSLIRIAL
jgi:hypothetical protein